MTKERFTSIGGPNVFEGRSPGELIRLERNIRNIKWEYPQTQFLPDSEIAILCDILDLTCASSSFSEVDEIVFVYNLTGLSWAVHGCPKKGPAASFYIGKLISHLSIRHSITGVILKSFLEPSIPHLEQ